MPLCTGSNQRSAGRTAVESNEQGARLRDFTQQSAQYVEAARKRYDAGNSISGYGRKKRIYATGSACGWGRHYARLFPEKSARLERSGESPPVTGDGWAVRAD